MISVLALSLVHSVLALTFREPDMTREREPFEAVPWSLQGAEITDGSGENDLVTFDRTMESPPPDFTIDLSSVRLLPTESGWSAVFRFSRPLPKEPQYPINFDLFFDKDGLMSNNATTGVFRAGSDLAFLLLFGTKTKWHTLTWTYDEKTGRWAQLTTPVEFSIGEYEATMHIPESLLAKEPPRKATVRAFALTSTGAVTVVDVAPGTGIPAVRGEDAPMTPAKGISPNAAFLGIFALLLGASLAFWYRGSRR